MVRVEGLARGRDVGMFHLSILLVSSIVQHYQSAVHITISQQYNTVSKQ